MARKYALLGEVGGKTIAVAYPSKKQAKAGLKFTREQIKFTSSFGVKNPRIRRVK